MKKFVIPFLLVSFVNLSIPAVAKEIVVKNTTRIPIMFEEEYTSKNVAEGQKINAIIASDVKIQDKVIFKTGDKATLNVSEVKKAGFVGNGGELYLMNGEAIDTKGNSHLIEYHKKIAGEDKTYPKVLLATSVFFLFPLALFGFVKGGQAKVKTGEITDAVLRSDFTYID